MSSPKNNQFLLVPGVFALAAFATALSRWVERARSQGQWSWPSTDAGYVMLAILVTAAAVGGAIVGKKYAGVLIASLLGSACGATVSALATPAPGMIWGLFVGFVVSRSLIGSLARGVLRFAAIIVLGLVGFSLARRIWLDGGPLVKYTACLVAAITLALQVAISRLKRPSQVKSQWWRPWLRWTSTFFLIGVVAYTGWQTEMHRRFHSIQARDGDVRMSRIGANAQWLGVLLNVPVEAMELRTPTEEDWTTLTAQDDLAYASVVGVALEAKKLQRLHDATQLGWAWHDPRGGRFTTGGQVMAQFAGKGYKRKDVDLIASFLPTIAPLSVTFAAPDLQASDFEAFDSFSRILSLTLVGRQFDDDGLEQVFESLRRSQSAGVLARLAIGDATATGESFALLNNFPLLTHLTLKNTPITPDNLSSLARTRVAWLCIRDTPIDNDTLRGLASLSLVELHLDCRSASDDLDLSLLSQMNGLTKLHLWDPPPGAPQQVATCKLLTHLHLIGNRIDDSGAVELQRLTSLRYLHVSSKQVSDNQLDRLRRKLTQCEVHAGPSERFPGIVIW